ASTQSLCLSTTFDNPALLTSIRAFTAYSTYASRPCSPPPPPLCLVSAPFAPDFISSLRCATSDLCLVLSPFVPSFLCSARRYVPCYLPIPARLAAARL